MTYIRLMEVINGMESDIAFFSQFQVLNESPYMLGLDRVTAWDFKCTDIIDRGTYKVEIVYTPMPFYKQVLVTEDELLTAQFKALENNEQGMAYASQTVDYETLREIQEILRNHAITAIQFETYTGDITNLHIRYGYPADRADDNAWYKVIAV